METKDIIAFILIEIATLVMAYAWLQRFVYNPYNWVIIFCLLIVVGVATYMILSVNSRLNEIEERMESRDKAIRVSIMTVEADLENQLQKLNHNVESAVSEINKKRFI
ncbi:hypothetical protein MmiAt1_08510 [Methanimicrococcus sp. At1]|uniref:Uncharacterized protein n=1 Tax=Methanimicrococcus hacksteinii TaxID=3028293 RepID=A0ABU3VPG3_9EURY|nr:hypothetical protein [Methanimicrococcus sp. At1]MDV0445283.1 hypothetical protein [Methanimicrococcus sp. At1]